VYVIVWRFVVRPEAAVEFEKHYGPAGTWATLFARGAGFVRTELFRSTANDREFVTFDHWQSKEAFLAFEAEHGDEYAAIDRDLERLTESEERLGDFSM